MLKGKRAIGTAAAAALCITAIMGTMVIFAQGNAERDFEDRQGQAAGVEGQSPVYGSEASNLYKDAAYKDQDIIKAVCQKYGLDYDTVTKEEITSEMFDYEIALWLRKEMGERPVLGDTGWGDPDRSTLEIHVNDIHAFYGAAPIIEEVCRQAGLDPLTAVINDLTEEQLMDIMATAFETSDHS